MMELIIGIIKVVGVVVCSLLAMAAAAVLGLGLLLMLGWIMMILDED